MIVTANKWFQPLRWQEFAEKVIKPTMQKYGIEPQGYSDLSPIIAIVRQGRWLVLCPDCNGAERAWEEGWMMCMSCWNGYTKHQYRKVIFPSERLEIENILEPRPLQNRNWEQGELMADLRKQNIEHGIVIPKPISL